MLPTICIQPQSYITLSRVNNHLITVKYSIKSSNSYIAVFDIEQPVKTGTTPLCGMAKQSTVINSTARLFSKIKYLAVVLWLETR